MRRTAPLEGAWWSWRAIRRAVAVTRAASFDTWGRVFRNEGTLGRDCGGDLRGNAVEECSFRATGGVAAAAAGAEIGRSPDRIGHGKAAGLGDKRTAVSKKDLAFDRCLSFGRR